LHELIYRRKKTRISHTVAPKHKLTALDRNYSGEVLASQHRPPQLSHPRFLFV